MKSIAWAVGIGLPVCGGAIGYACGGTNGAVYGVAAGLAAFILARLVVSLRHENVHRADYADDFVSRKLKSSNSDTDASEELSCPVSDVERHVVRNRNAHDVASRKARVWRAPRLTDGLSGQSARHIRRFWCYRTPSQTLLFVRLRAGKLYCMYMNRSGKGEGARWVVRKIEGEEYGALSEKLKNMAHAMDY